MSITTKYILPTFVALTMMYNANAKDSDDNILQTEVFLSGHASMQQQLVDGFEMDLNPESGSMTVNNEFLSIDMITGQVSFQDNENYPFENIFIDYPFTFNTSSENYQALNDFDMYFKGDLAALAKLKIQKGNFIMSLEAGKFGKIDYSISGEVGIKAELVHGNDATWEDFYTSAGVEAFLPDNAPDLGGFIREGNAYLEFHNINQKKEGHSIRFLTEKRNIQLGFMLNDGNFIDDRWWQNFDLQLDIEGDALDPKLVVPYQFVFDHLKRSGEFFDGVFIFGYDDGLWRMLMETGVGIKRYDIYHSHYIIEDAVEINWNDFGIELFNLDEDALYFVSDLIQEYFYDNVDAELLFKVNAERKLDLDKIVLLPYGGVGLNGFNVGLSGQYGKFIGNFEYDSEERFEADLILDLNSGADCLKMLQDERFAENSYFELSNEALTYDKLNYYSKIKGAVVRTHFEPNRASAALAFGFPPHIFFEVMTGISKQKEIQEVYGSLTFGAKQGLVRMSITNGRNKTYNADFMHISFDAGVLIQKDFMLQAKGQSDLEETIVSLGVKKKF